MKWYYIYERASGKLISDTSVRPTKLRPELSFTETSHRINLRRSIWDTSTRDFTSRPTRRVITLPEFLDRMSEGEKEALMDSPEAVQSKFRTFLAAAESQRKGVNLSAKTTESVVRSLEAAAVITLDRAATILTP